MELLVVNVVALLALLLIGIPVPMAFCGAALLAITMSGAGVFTLVITGATKLGSVAMFAVPLFIMAGGLMEHGGTAALLVNWVRDVMGKGMSRLGTISVVLCGMFGAVSGSASAALCAIGGIMIPELKKDGYSPEHATALLSVAAVLALLIPPSIDMIMYGWLTDTSVAACFLATVGPGILVIVLLSLVNWFMLRRIPAPSATRPRVGPSLDLRGKAKTILRSTGRAALVLIMPVIILGGIYGGVFTPTEAGAVAVVYGAVLFLIYRGADLRALGRSLLTSGTTSGAIMMMFFFIVILTHIYTMENIPQTIASALLAISATRHLILLMVVLFLIIVGMLMGDTPGLMLATPLLFPVAQELGVHPLHFAAIMGTTMGMGSCTPPAAPLLYIGTRIGGVTIDRMLKPTVLLLVFGFFPAIMVTTFWPDLSLFIPRLFGFVR